MGLTKRMREQLKALPEVDEILTRSRPSDDTVTYKLIVAKMWKYGNMYPLYVRRR